MRIVPPVLGMLAIVACAGIVRASQPAYDSAADSAYNNGWTQGSNGGFGWAGGWTLGTPASAFIGSSTTNGGGDPDGDGDINTPRSAVGRAWGLTQISTATRMFSGPLELEGVKGTFLFLKTTDTNDTF